MFEVCGEIPLFPTSINIHLPSGPVHPYKLDESISNSRGIWCTFSISVASDLALHCLPMSQKWYARLLWVNRDKRGLSNWNISFVGFF